MSLADILATGMNKIHPAELRSTKQITNSGAPNVSMKYVQQVRATSLKMEKTLEDLKAAGITPIQKLKKGNNFYCRRSLDFKTEMRSILSNS